MIDQGKLDIIKEVNKQGGFHDDKQMWGSIDETIIREKYLSFLDLLEIKEIKSKNQQELYLAGLILEDWSKIDDRDYFQLDDENIYQIQMAIQYAVKTFKLDRKVLKISYPSKPELETEESGEKLKKRAIALIDSPNFWHTYTGIMDIKYIHFGLLIDSITYLRPDLNIIERRSYCKTMSQDLMDKFRNQGLKIVCQPEKDKDKDIDSLIIADIEKIIKNQDIEAIILFSGDKHYRKCLESAKDSSKEIIIISHIKNVSRELTNRFVYMDLEAIINFMISFSEDKNPIGCDNVHILPKKNPGIEINIDCGEKQKPAIEAVVSSAITALGRFPLEILDKISIINIS